MESKNEDDAAQEAANGGGLSSKPETPHEQLYREQRERRLAAEERGRARHRADIERNGEDALPATLLLAPRIGRPSFRREQVYQLQLARFCNLIKEINSTLDFSIGSRGWCYSLEPYGLRKGDFGKAEKLISECRKTGDLPLDICCDDPSRETLGVEDLDINDVPKEAVCQMRAK